MTTRRLLLLVDGLSRMTSRFWCLVLDQEPLSIDQIILSDLYAAWTNQVHPVRTMREDARKRREKEAKHARIRARERRRKRISRTY